MQILWEFVLNKKVISMFNIFNLKLSDTLSEILLSVKVERINQDLLVNADFSF